MEGPSRGRRIGAALPLPENDDESGYDRVPGIGPSRKGIHRRRVRLPLPVAPSAAFARVVDIRQATPGDCRHLWNPADSPWVAGVEGELAPVYEAARHREEVKRQLAAQAERYGQEGPRGGTGGRHDESRGCRR